MRNMRIIIAAVIILISPVLSDYDVFAFQICLNNGNECKWPDSRATMYINVSNCVSGSSAAIQNAMHTWTNVPTSGFSFQYGGPSSSTSWGVNNSNNLISCGPLDEAQYADTVALTRKWLKSSGEITDADLIFNTNFGFTASGSYDAFDVETIALHELGHTFGLKDLYDSAFGEMVMFGYGNEGEIKRQLTYDDVDGTTYLYPENRCGGTYSISDNTLYLPTVRYGSASYWLDLEYVPRSHDALWFRLLDYGLLGRAGQFSDCNPPALSEELKLTVPVLYFSGWSYWAVLKYTPSNDGYVWFKLETAGSNW